MSSGSCSDEDDEPERFEVRDRSVHDACSRVESFDRTVEVVDGSDRRLR